MKTPQSCECGCGEMTKGGRFRPGHDSRTHGKAHQDKAVLNRMRGEMVSPNAKLEFSGRASKAGVRSGMKVRLTLANIDGKIVEGIVTYVSPWDWLVIVNAEGKQYVGHPHEVEVLESDLKKAAVALPPAQHHTIARLLGA